MNEGLNEFGSAGMEKRVFLFLLSFRKGKGGGIEPFGRENKFGITQAVALLRKYVTFLFSPLPLEVLEMLGISCSRNFKKQIPVEMLRLVFMENILLRLGLLLIPKSPIISGLHHYSRLHYECLQRAEMPPCVCGEGSFRLQILCSLSFGAQL